MKPFYLLLFPLILLSCGSIEKIPALPKEAVNIEEELEHIYKTDQKDRKKVLGKVLFQSEEKYSTDPKIIAVSNRDSIRLTRVMAIEKAASLNANKDKYHAAFIYLHAGGSKMTDDIAYLKRSSELFKDLMLNAKEEKWKKRGKTYYHESIRQLERLKQAE